MKQLRFFVGIYALVLLMFFVLYHPLYWDGGVYAGMAKYIYSGGQMGAWESIRPIGLPLMEGLLWRLGIPLPFAALMISFFSSITLVILVYFFTQKLFGKGAGLTAAAITAFHPIIMFYSPALLSEIPAMCLAIACFLALSYGHFVLGGVLLGAGVLTRFPTGILLLPVLAFIHLHHGSHPRHRWTPYINFFVPFVLVSSIQLMVNWITTGSPIAPLMDAQMVVQAHFSSPWYGYMPWVGIELLAAVLFFVFMKEKRHELHPYIIAALLPLLYFSAIAHKEPRYVMIMIPFLAIIIAVGCVQLRRMRIVCIAVLLIVLWLAYAPRLEAYQPEKPPVLEYEMLNMIDVPVLVSSPVHTHHLDVPVSVYSHRSYAVMKEEILEAQVSIIFNPCDIECVPGHEDCERNKMNLLKQAQRNLHIVSETFGEFCSTYVFVPTSYDTDVIVS